MNLGPEESSKQKTGGPSKRVSKSTATPEKESDEIEIEIDDNQKTLSQSDKYHDITLQFYPDVKKFRSTLSTKVGDYWRNESYEYRVSSNPIEASIRLRERSDEPPPNQYAVKDGVVLESEIKNEFRRKDFIEGLKKDVVWHKLELPGSYAMLFYILSLHPEIVPHEQYREFLRETQQRLKLGVQKVQEYLNKNDKTGLKILKISNSNYIWYPNVTNKNAEELEKKYTGYREDKIYKVVFSEKSNGYSGISKYEFEGSPDILKHLDYLLDQKQSAKTKRGVKRVGSGSKVRWIIVIVLSIIALSRGIWTAIGVFALGIIIISILSRRSFWK